MKLLILLMLSLICLVGVDSAKAETIPGTNLEIVSKLVVKDVSSGTYYQFETLEGRNIFVESNTKYKSRSNGVRATRRIFSHSYRDSGTSSAISTTAYGGRAGASLTVSAGAGFTHPKYGLGLSLGISATHNVPPYTYGYIILKSTFTVNVYRLEVQYYGSNRWHSAGRVHTFSNIRTWSELRTWK